MHVTIASFNIEKNGQSSDPSKQTKVSDFIDLCCKRRVDIIFLCEVHKVRIQDYVEFLREVYLDYSCDFLDGGYSNAYVVLCRKSAGFTLSFDGLKGLNRNFLLCHIENKVAIGFAHFKSGQTNLTKDQIEAGADFMNGFTNNTGRWAIVGDMNWDMHRFNELNLPANSRAATCWSDMTQKSGGILDWCLAGWGVALAPADGVKDFNPAFQVMDGPDHRPVVFRLEL